MSAQDLAPWQYEYRVLFGDGTTRWVLGNALPQREQDGSTLWHGFITDITESKRIREELESTQALFSIVLHHAPIYTYIKEITSAGSRMLQASNNFDQLIGASGLDMAGKTMFELFPAEFAEKITADDISVVAGGAVMKVDEDFNGRNYTTIKFPIVHGGKTLLAGFTIDITERKQMEEELQKKNAEMESFTYTVSHDLKSPLVTIKTFLGYLEKDLKAQKSKHVAEDIGFILGAANKMGRLLEELLELARIGHTMNAHVEMPLQEVVQEALSLVAGQISERGVQVDVTEEPVWLCGDRTRLVQVFQNLVDNAVKFFGDQPSPRIEIGVAQVGGELEIFVRDNGKGFDPRHQSKLFGLFEKLDASQPGSGLGLAMVKRMVELHGGKIRAESAGVGLGATFLFTLAQTRLKPQEGIRS